MAYDGVDIRQCQKCGVPSSSTRRIRACTRCYSVGYCSKSCQRADWIGGEGDGGGHKSQCRPRPRPASSWSADPSPAAEGGNGVARLEVKRGNGGGDDGDGAWEDVGPINLLEGMANATNRPNTLPVPNNDASAKQQNLIKELPATTRRILGPTSAYIYRHSPDRVDENLLIFFHGAGDSHLPYDALGQQMELPQTATLSLSASLSLDPPVGKTGSNHGGKDSPQFVELPFGLGHTWFEEMDYFSSGETLPLDHPRRLTSLEQAVELVDSLLRSLMGHGDLEDENETHAVTTSSWVPERIFLFGFSAGACLVMGLCRARRDAGRMPLGGAVCVAGGIRTEGKLPGTKRKDWVDIDGYARRGRATDVLITVGMKDPTYTKEAAQASKRFYCPSSVQLHLQKGKRHSMIESEGEMRAVMEFLSKRLVRRTVSMGSHCN